MTDTATTAAAQAVPGPGTYRLAILLALTRLRKHVYPGTVPEAVKSRRRAKNKVAKASRKANRK